MQVLHSSHPGRSTGSAASNEMDERFLPAEGLHPKRSTMPRTRSSSVIPHLAREQANAVVLYLQYKGYHWNVAGPLFRELHLLFDEHAEKVLSTIDPLAKRQRMLGFPAAYRWADLHAASSLPKEEDLPRSPREMVERLLVAHRIVVEGMHDGFKSAESDSDPGSADLFARMVQEHQKMEWFLRELASDAPSLREEPQTVRAPMGAADVLVTRVTPPHVPSPIPGPNSGS